MLGKTLRSLEADGLITRRVYPTIPRRVDYTLTPLGQSLMEPLDALVHWAVANHGQIRAARTAYQPPETADA